MELANFCCIEGQGWFLPFHVFTLYVKVTFFRGTSLRPVPPGGHGAQQGRALDRKRPGISGAAPNHALQQTPVKVDLLRLKSNRAPPSLGHGPSLAPCPENQSAILNKYENRDPNHSTR